MNNQEKLVIHSVYIKNFKSILEIDQFTINDGYIADSGMIPILGLNGAGKSNILKAIAWFKTFGKKESIDDLRNIYHKSSGLNSVVVGLNFSNISHYNEDIAKSFVEKLIDENNSSLNDNMKRFLTELPKSNMFSIYKKFDYRDEGKTKVLYSFCKELDGTFYPGDGLNEFIQERISNFIYGHILNNFVPEIILLDTKKTLREFSLQKTPDIINYLGNRQLHQFSFSDIFRYTSVESLTSPKNILINNIFRRIEECNSLKKYIDLCEKVENQNKNLINTNEANEIVRIQRRFNDLITQDGFFRSINGDINFYIFPEFNHETKQIRLTIFDKVNINNETKNYRVQDISFKNDGFIFALILYLQIEYYLPKHSITLIDEPANFLSSSSIKVLMERFYTISKTQRVTFIYTTHSSYTLDKNLVDLNNLVIAKRGKDFATKIFNIYSLRKENIEKINLSNEAEIINDAYYSSKIGKDLIQDKINYLVKTDNQFKKNQLKIINRWTTTDNYIGVVNPRLLLKNYELNKKVSEENKGFIIKEFDGILINLFDNNDIKSIAEKYQIVNNGIIDITRLKENVTYKNDILKRIIDFFTGTREENNFELLFKNSKKNLSNFHKQSSKDSK